MFAMTPIGLNNMDSIRVSDGINSQEFIEIPVKMKAGFYSPYLNRFDSDKSIKDLCEVFVNNENDGDKEYEIFDDVVYLTKSISGEIIARAVLYDRKGDDKEFEYDLSDMQVKGCILPVHLFNEVGYEYSADNVSIYTSAITLSEMNAWLNDLEYTVIVTDNMITTSTCAIEFKENNVIEIVSISS